nr:MAG TPA: hypothetical protein [Caudoviricetes sp.]
MFPACITFQEYLRSLCQVFTKVGVVYFMLIRNNVR